MIIHHGLLLSFFAVFLQIAVFLQPLLPEKFQVAPVCEKITLALLQQKPISTHHTHVHQTNNHHNHVISDTVATESQHHHHDASHQCQYCTVYANLILPPESEVKEVLGKIHVQWIWLQQQFEHVYFALQRLFLLPQGRAPPTFS